ECRLGHHPAHGDSIADKVAGVTKVMDTIVVMAVADKAMVNGDLVSVIKAECRLGHHPAHGDSIADKVRVMGVVVLARMVA
ncbi:MAG: hypothetical protein WCN98_10730, partial [Verrucomicrobiaceae bacterium]